MNIQGKSRPTLLKSTWAMLDFPAPCDAQKSLLTRPHAHPTTDPSSSQPAFHKMHKERKKKWESKQDNNKKIEEGATVRVKLGAPLHVLSRLIALDKSGQTASAVPFSFPSDPFPRPLPRRSPCGEPTA